MTEKQNVLVTGGAGYVGSHACKALHESGFRPIVIDNLSHGHEWAVQWGPLVEGDIHEVKMVADVIRSFNACAVFHFAASAYVEESVRKPLDYYRNNVSGTISLLTAMEETGLDTLIFSSTCAVYGAQDEGLLIESSPKKPCSPYGHTKHAVETMLDDLSRHGKLRHVALRYFNAAGADPGSTIGEDHNPETHLIPSAIRAALNADGDDAPLKIFGTDFPTPDGTAIRDYIHVNDLAAAHVAALRYILAGNKPDNFNLGTGVGHSVLAVIKGLQALGLDVPVELAQRRRGDPASLVANPEKAHRILGWRATMSDLENILETAVTWHRKMQGQQQDAPPQIAI